MALRDNESIETEFWLDDSTRQPEELLDLQYRAFNSQNSGSSVSDNDSTTMTEWRIFRDWPFIFVGMASSSQHDILRLFLDLLPWFLAATALVIILFLTEIMSRLFMGPVETILAGIREVSQNNNLHLKIQIKNNDEFDMLGNAFNSMTAGLLQKKHISRFISSGIHKRDENEHTVINGKAAVLASDIRGFTTLSEQESPESVVALLNDYFTLMESAIISEQGTIDKYIGDAIIAVFREGQLQNPSLAACRAAIKMRAAIAQLTENSPLKIDNGIGISTGEITMVHVGDANSRRDIIMMGKPVETAEELEAMTKSGTYSRIFIDSATATAVNNEFLLSEQAETTPTAIFEIIKAAEASS
jgi:class 3 adenylate cyclase/HAMP domain-containing protein